jgi:hypothetical protein
MAQLQDGPGICLFEVVVEAGGDRMWSMQMCWREGAFPPMSFNLFQCPNQSGDI